METKGEGRVGRKCGECFDKDVCRFFKLCMFGIELVSVHQHIINESAKKRWGGEGSSDRANLFSAHI